MATQKQKDIALQLLQKHDKAEVFVNKRTGHMHFSKTNALLGAKSEEEIEVLTKEELDGKKAAKKAAAPTEKPENPKG